MSLGGGCIFKQKAREAGIDEVTHLDGLTEGEIPDSPSHFHPGF